MNRNISKMILITEIIHASLAMVAIYCLHRVIQHFWYSKKAIHDDVNITPVPRDYNWREEKVAQYRPFKAQYRETMNISKLTHENWLVIDSDYDIITDYHKEVLEEHSEETCQALKTPQTSKASQELYDFTIATLVQRYPQYFEDTGTKVINKIKNREIPRKSITSGLSAGELLRILCENTEEDFILLEYDPESSEYRLCAVAGVSSGGNLWISKLGKKMTDIHGPVPGYKEYLKFSMNKYFKKLKVGQWVQRITWFLQIADSPYAEWMGKPNPVLSDEKVLDFDNEVFTRITRQILTRLPKTSYLAFTQRTYLYPLSKVKSEGFAEVLRANIETMPDDVGEYRGRTSWGEQVLGYLRS